MGIFEQFPYTNFHDLNLDWILHAIRSMDKKLDEFVASNVLSYADPIQWDIETQYAKNTVVIDPKTGTAYMSINPVPVGQLLTNKYYWQPIFNYDEIVNTLKKQIAAVQADQHDIIHVSVGRGDLVWVANKLYRLTKSLDVGSKIIENENAVPVTVEEIINDIDARLIKEISDRESADTTITNNLNKEISDRENADTTITNNLNKEIGDRSKLIKADENNNTVIDTDNNLIENITGNYTGKFGSASFETGATSWPVKFPDKTVDLHDIDKYKSSFINVLDFGAKGDGITDDTEAFRSAIEYCIENGTALFVPAVTPLSDERGYILSKTLNIDYPMTFICDPLSTLYWKNAHTNNDQTVNVGRNNAKKYESGYGINIDYGTYGGHKGFYQFGIIQGDKSFIKQNATLPTGNYWVGINIQSADLVHLKAEYVNYWLVGTKLHSNDTGGVENCRIELGVIDDCNTGINVLSSANGCYTNYIHFNTIGQGVYGISFNPINDIANNVITGEQILVEAPDGLNIGVFDATNAWNFKNNKITVKSCFNGVTPNTKNRHGYSGEPFWGTILSGNHNFRGIGYGACGIGDEYELGFWDYSSGKGNMAYCGGDGCTLKNTCYNAINQNYTPVLSDQPINLSDFNNGGMIPSNVFMLEYVTKDTVPSNKVLSLWFFATCLPIDCVSQFSVEPMFWADKYYIENWNGTTTGLARILYKSESGLAVGTHLKFLVRVGC